MTSAGTAIEFADAAPMITAAYLLQPLLKMAGELKGLRVLDVGCGNGFLAGEFLKHGSQVVGTDISESGIAVARKNYPTGRFEVAPADDQILHTLGELPFDLIISTEVVEHLYAPRPYVMGCFTALKPGGMLVCSTPYNGYLKNVLVALSNKYDAHVNPLWDGGHIKMWSRQTLTKLLAEAGFIDFKFQGAGRLPWLWKSMLISCRKKASA